jgi:hypothetical protein
VVHILILFPISAGLGLSGLNFLLFLGFLLL